MADQPLPTNQTSNETDPAMSATSVHITVRDRRKVIYEADARAVTTYSQTGLFDILPQHANFISLVQQAIIVHTVDGKRSTIEIDNGILKVKDNTIHCYVNLLVGK